jgi:hypothetical protein
MMTREEAILLSAYTGFLLVPDFSDVHKFCEDTLGRPIWTHEFADQDVQKEIREKLRPQIMELVQNIVALRPISRERIEKVWRGEWMAFDECSNEGVYCKRCKKKVYRIEYANEKMRPPFCPSCGAPMTDEALEMVMERLEALNEKD